MNLAERLRGVIKPASDGAGGAGPGNADRAGSARDTSAARPVIDRDAAAETLGGEWRSVNGHRYLVVDRKYSPGYRHGNVCVADALPPWPQLPLLAGNAGGRMLFLDLETTGLAGGAGTYAFLVGLAWFDPPSRSATARHAAGCFWTRQYFLASYGGEKALLDAVIDDVEGTSTVVTYNGKSFDIPLLDTRFVMHRMETPFAGLPHVDMLHPARRLWRGGDEEGGCRLTMLEETLCGHRREGDVPGFEIPARYFHYVRSGDARPLEAVLEHNRLDLLALAMITARASQLLDEGPAAARTAREAFGLGKLYERGARLNDAIGCYMRAEELPGDVETTAEALRAYASLSRRLRRHNDAAAAWRRVLSLRRCPPVIAREAAEALAVHHEHRARDLHAAKTFAMQSLQFNVSASRQQAVRHRLARLDRKIGEPSAPLF